MASDVEGPPAYNDQVRQVVDAAPPVSKEQRERLALILRGEGGDVRAA